MPGQHRGAHRLKKELVVRGPLAQAAPLYMEGLESAPNPGLAPPSDWQMDALSSRVQLLPEFILYF